MSNGPVLILGQSDPRVMMEASLTQMFTKVLGNLSALPQPQPQLLASVQEMQAKRQAVNVAVLSTNVTPDSLGTLLNQFKVSCEAAIGLAVDTKDPDVIGSVRCLIEFSNQIDQNYPRAELSH